MNEVISRVYASATGAKNAMEDLLATGIPREEIYLDAETHEIKVMVPASARPEVTEILQRHQPTETS
jgi:hypothetical protein